VTPSITSLQPAKDLKRVEAEIKAAGAGATTEVGAGGAADSAHR
jgi:hypothetical protein